MKDQKIFDIHTHVYPERISAAAVKNLGDFYEFHVEGAGTFAELAQTSKDCGVCGFLALAVATNPKQVLRVNDSVAEAVAAARKQGFDAHAFGGFHQDCPDADEVVCHALDVGLEGIKLHPDIQGVDIDDKRLFPLYELCEKKHLPVYFHMGDARPQYRFSEARKLARVIERYPDLKVGAAHLGGYSAWEDAALLAGAKNVWFDTSSTLWATSAAHASELIHLLGTNRVMFGTDYPVKTAAQELEYFARLELTDEERADVLYNNSRAFLNLPLETNV